jgi:hypothetical protein
MTRTAERIQEGARISNQVAGEIHRSKGAIELMGRTNITATHLDASATSRQGDVTITFFEPHGLKTNKLAFGRTDMFAELQIDGTYRVYIWDLGPQRTDGDRRLRALIPTDFPEDTDWGMLDRETMTFLNGLVDFLSTRGDFVKPGITEGLPEDPQIVRRRY